MSVARRIIPCLDVRDGRVVKGVRFREHRDLGDVLDLALRYRDAGADELVFYDITASPEQRSADIGWIAGISRELDIPFCVAGGIRDVQTAENILHAGADKISVNTPALLNPELIDELAERFGSQCVVVGVDSIRSDDRFEVRSFTGDPKRIQREKKGTLEWISEVQARGAGEIVLNCMDNDGVRGGYDIEQLQVARAICAVPLIASGGAGRQEHFASVFQAANVDGALAAGVFHADTIAIPELKQFLEQQGITVRT